MHPARADPAQSCVERNTVYVHGGIIVGCRRRGDSVRNRGVGQRHRLAEDHHRNIFAEFYQVGAATRVSALGWAWDCRSSTVYAGCSTIRLI